MAQLEWVSVFVYDIEITIDYVLIDLTLIVSGYSEKSTKYILLRLFFAGFMVIGAIKLVKQPFFNKLL